MSTPSPEKDSLLGQLVHEKIAYQNLKHDGFFGTTLYAHASVQVFLVPDTMGKIIRYFCSFVHLTIYLFYGHDTSLGKE